MFEGAANIVLAFRMFEGAANILLAFRGFTRKESFANSFWSTKAENWNGRIAMVSQISRCSNHCGLQACLL